MVPEPVTLPGKMRIAIHGIRAAALFDFNYFKPRVAPVLAGMGTLIKSKCFG